MSVANIGDPLQALNARAASFFKGKEYPALVAAKVDETNYLVKVEESLYQMNLGRHASVGQNLLLQYMHADPVPTFVLSPKAADFSKTADTMARVSPLAHQIAEAVRQAEAAGISARYEAAQVVSVSPAIAQVLAADLKKALERSGLFYESHLQEYLAGHRALSEIRLEPQNQQQASASALLPQQLSILEQQRLSWHGEVWPGQKMNWNIDLQDHHRESGDDPSEQQTIATDMTLHLPRLGEVKATIRLHDGQVRIALAADVAQTLTVMQTEMASLSHAITRHGQRLNELTVNSHA